MESSLISRSSSSFSIGADPLSDVLALLKPRGYMSGGLDLGGAWCIGFERFEGVLCFALVHGECWLAVDGVPEPVLLKGGDCVVLPHPRAFRLASDLSLRPLDIMTVIQEPLYGRIAQWNGGGSCLGLSALFTLSGEHPELLLGVLPTIIHISDDADRAAMRWYIERMMKVLREPQPGGFLLGQHLAQMILIEALRLYLSDKLNQGVGWLYALADKPLNAAITAMHAKPGRRWTLKQLGERAGMSRSIFALRFKQKVGVSAMEYLTRWRMARAADRLTNTADSVSDIALSLGYESESAFGATFKRVMGRSPRQYARSKTTADRA